MTTLREETGWLARACHALEAVAMALLVVMTAFIIVQVVARNVLALGFPWAEELARYAGLGVVYLTIPLLLLDDRHVKVDILLKLTRGLPARMVATLNELLVVAFCLASLYGGWRFLQRAAQFSTAALGIPNWLYYTPAAIGMVMLTVVAFARLARILRGGTAS